MFVLQFDLWREVKGIFVYTELFAECFKSSLHVITTWNPKKAR